MYHVIGTFLDTEYQRQLNIWNPVFTKPNWQHMIYNFPSHRKTENYIFENISLQRFPINSY